MYYATLDIVYTMVYSTECVYAIYYTVYDIYIYTCILRQPRHERHPGEGVVALLRLHQAQEADRDRGRKFRHVRQSQARPCVRNSDDRLSFRHGPAGGRQRGRLPVGGGGGRAGVQGVEV